MSEYHYTATITNLGAHEPRELACITEDGTLLRAEIIEASTRHFKARILEPFRRTLFHNLPLFVIALTPFGFVSGDGKATPLLTDKLEVAMVTAYLEWQREQQGKEHFLANRAILTPQIRETHRQAAKLCRDAEAIVEDMRVLAGILEEGVLQMRGDYRLQFKNGIFTQQEYQTRLKELQKYGPPTALCRFALAEGTALQTRFKALHEQLELTQEIFSQNTHLQFGEATGFLHLEPLPLDPWQWWDAVNWLPRLSLTVHLMLMAHP